MLKEWSEQDVNKLNDVKDQFSKRVDNLKKELAKNVSGGKH
jgi:hypothetical protein